MQTILNNPYRTIGLLVGATAAEQRRQLTRLMMFLEADQKPEVGFSFPTLGSIKRTIKSVKEAESKLNLDNDKINAALFWFWNGNPISDEGAFDALKEGDIEAAYEIWDNLITETTENGKRLWKPVTEKNYSAFHNCSILNIIKSNGNLHNGILANLYFLESDYVHKFVSTIADKTYKTDKKELQLIFLNQLLTDIEENQKTTFSKFIEILYHHDFIAKQDFLKSIAQKLYEKIGQKIEVAKTKRKANKENAANAGNELYESVGNQFIHLKNILGDNDLMFNSYSDKISGEILQCGIDYFLNYRDSNFDPSHTSLELFKKAKIFAKGNIAIQRCLENTNQLINWINGKPEREKLRPIKHEYNLINKRINEFENSANNISSCLNFIEFCKPQLIKIKSQLGRKDLLYVKISSSVVKIALFKLIKTVNDSQKQIEHYNNLSITKNIDFFDSLWDKSNHLNQKIQAEREFVTIIKDSLIVFKEFKNMDIDEELKNLVKTNFKKLTEINDQITNKEPWMQQNSGCFTILIFAIIGGIIGIATFPEDNSGIIPSALIGALIGAVFSKLFKNE